MRPCESALFSLSLTNCVPDCLPLGYWGWLNGNHRSCGYTWSGGPPGYIYGRVYCRGLQGTISVPIPANILPGQYSIEARCGLPGAFPCTALATITVLDPPLNLTAQVITQDDPTYSVWNNLPEGFPVYGGSEASTADNLRVRVTPPAGQRQSIDWSWHSRGGSFRPSNWYPPTGPDALEWDLGDILNPTPGPVDINVVVRYTDGSCLSGRYSTEIGVRTDDVVIIGWINPDLITLPAVNNGATPPVWFVNPIIVNAMPANGVVSNRLECNLMVADLSESMITVGPGGPPLTFLDREYILSWLFKYGQNNFSPAYGPPPDDFIGGDNVMDFDEIDDVAAVATGFKFFSELQIRYRINDTGTFVPTVLRKKAKVGDMKNPCGAVAGYLDVIPGQQGFATVAGYITSDHVSTIVDASPDAAAVRVFDTLTASYVLDPEAWANVGARVLFDSNNRTTARIAKTPFPSFYIYVNGHPFHPIAQSTIRGQFFGPGDSDYPVYPFGLVPCTAVFGTIPDSRCGNAVLSADPSSVTPDYTIP